MRRQKRQTRRRLQLEGLESRQLLAGDLRVTELNFSPHAALPQFGERPNDDPDDFEFVEVTNVGDGPLELRDYRFTSGVQFVFGRQSLNPGERLVITRNLKDFQSRFGNNIRIAIGNDGNGGDEGEYGGRLSNDGEEIELRDSNNRVIHRFTYYPKGHWPKLADGGGSSLEILDPFGDANDWRNWRASSDYGGSPGREGLGWNGDVVINEVLSHTDPPEIDTIELYNRSDRSIDMTGWYLTDSPSQIFQFPLPADVSTIGPHDYRVYDANQFIFQLKGNSADDVYLIQSDATGKPIRFMDAVYFQATANGVSEGRWRNGQGLLFAQVEQTFEDPNAGPLLPVVLMSEVHYHPAPPPQGSSLSEDDMEFVEIYNRTDTPLDIGQWRLSDAVEYTFPTIQILPARESLLVVGFNPATSPQKTREFRAFYGIDDQVPILGPYSDQSDPNPDQLGNRGDTLILDRPEDLTMIGIGYIVVDRLPYSPDGDWPQDAAGRGSSLTRAGLELFGDFPENWTATVPSPGRIGLPGDVNGDGKVDADDIDQTCLAAKLGGANSTYDLNRDGLVNGADVDFLIQDILKTDRGDANLDGLFNSTDMVYVFLAGEYEDSIPGNSGWDTGDWNCDFDFTSSDMIAAFLTGTYEQPAPAELIHEAATEHANLGAVAAAVAADELFAIGDRSSIKAAGDETEDAFDPTASRQRVWIDAQHVDKLFV